MSVLEVTEMQKSPNLPLNSCSEFSFYKIDKGYFKNDVFRNFSNVSLMTFSEIPSGTSPMELFLRKQLTAFSRSKKQQKNQSRVTFVILHAESLR